MPATKAIVERSARLDSAWQEITLAVEPAAAAIAPGQFFLARAGASWEPYLRRLWLPAAGQADRLTFEVPAPTAPQPGQLISLLGPLGRPIELSRDCQNLLLTAHDFRPGPLLFLARRVLAAGGAVTVVFSGQAKKYPLERLPEEIEVVGADDDGFWPSQERIITWADQIVAAAGPGGESYYARLRQAATDLRPRPRPGFLQAFFLPPMPCGLGACGACAVSTKEGEKLACRAGPVFDLYQVRLGD